MPKEERKKEIRLRSTVIKRAAGEESRKIEGYAVLFNVQSDGMDFKETINKGSIDEETIKRSNIFCLLNHSTDRGVLARSKEGKGTLALTVDDKGLFFSFEAPHTTLGDEVLEYLTRGEIDSCSFAFNVDTDEWVRNEVSGDYERIITKVHKLFDVSLVYDAAYSKTEVDRRGLDSILNKNKELEKRKKTVELAAYYATLKNDHNF